MSKNVLFNNQVVYELSFIEPSELTGSFVRLHP
jgi:hypothetical protein